MYDYVRGQVPQIAQEGLQYLCKPIRAQPAIDGQKTQGIYYF
jgi:hypothetical protein